MRSIFGNGKEALAFLPSDDPQRGWYAEVESAHLMADDTFQAAKVRGHPDPRGAAILALNREAYTIQAIGRIRAVKPGLLKRILILSSLVLPGLPVNRLVHWQELVTGLPRSELGVKSQRLEAALYPDGGRWSVMGLRLSASGIKEDAPEAFEAAHSGTEWRRDLTTEAIRDMIRAIARRRGARPIFVELRRPGGGKRIPAVLFDQDNVVGAIARRWPGLELVSVVDGPDHNDEDEQDEPRPQNLEMASRGDRHRTEHAIHQPSVPDDRIVVPCPRKPSSGWKTAVHQEA